MNREDAVNAVEKIREASVQINSVARLFRERLNDEGSKQIILGCGRVLASMHDELLKQIFAEYPDLEAESRQRALAALSRSQIE
jgi:hypothetical protein